MELSELERTILESLQSEELMSLKMITANIRKSQETVSKQRVWNTLQLLCAKDLVEKVDRGLYRLKKEKH